MNKSASAAASAARVGPMFKWFGSKWQAAKHYPAPTHRVIVEPFAGGAGFALNYSDHDVVLWDDDPNLQVLWPWLINEAAKHPSMIREIPVDVPVGTDIRAIGLSSGQAMLLKHWQRTNSCGDCWTVSPWGGLPGQWTPNTRARVADQVGAIAHWQFKRPVEVLDTPDAVAHWFIDPPYLYNYRYRAGLPEFDFEHLANWITELPAAARVVVCEAARKSDGVLPTYLPFTYSHRSVTSRRKSTQSHHSSECMWVREPG